MGKRSKGHDKDKYYHLAKDQGYRARSAFKLIEINKKHGILTTAQVVIDLCAAPGSWCQVAQKAMPSGGLVLGVDLLPIRPIRGVKTLIGDITTDETRRMITRELQTMRANVVLCDGAPNVGAAYSKDAYVQNEIALAALKVATQHLTQGGSFVTKVYRSQDYNSLVYVLQQFFDEYHAVKPASSRAQSAEIFLVGLGYKDPASIDPRMLDPRAVFDQSHEESARKGVTIFHKKFEQHNKRQRGGYDDDLGPTLSRVASVSEFVDSADPVRLLTDYNVLKFGEGCAIYRSSASTTVDILASCEDLKLLGKADFKHLLKWREKMRQYRDELQSAAEKDAEEKLLEEKDKEGKSEKEDGNSENDAEEGGGAAVIDSDEEEEEVQQEIKELRLKLLAEKKRVRKKEREAASRLRKRVAMGMETSAIDLPDDEATFTLNDLKGGNLNDLAEADLERLDASDVGVGSGDEADDADELEENDEIFGAKRGAGSGDESGDSDGEHDATLEDELEAAYNVYLTGRSKDSLEGTRTAKRTKLARANKAAAEQQEDVAMYDGDQKAYLKLLAGQENSDDENNLDSSDEDDARDMDSSDASSDSDGGGINSAAKKKSAKRPKISAESDDESDGGGSDGASSGAAAGASMNGRAKAPLLTDLLSDKARRSDRTSRWFSNPLFEGIADVTAAEEQLQLQLPAVTDVRAAVAAVSAKGGKRARKGDVSSGVTESVGTSSAEGDRKRSAVGEAAMDVVEAHSSEEAEAPKVENGPQKTVLKGGKKYLNEVKPAEGSSSNSSKANDKAARLAAAKAAREAVNEAFGNGSRKKNGDIASGDEDDDEDSDVGGAAAAVLASMPKTDKQVRKEKRKKAAERKERRDAKKSRKGLEEDEDLQVIAADDEMEGMTPQERQRVLRKRQLIRAGMGMAVSDDNNNTYNNAVTAVDENVFGNGKFSRASNGGKSMGSSSGYGGGSSGSTFEVARASAIAGQLRGGDAAAAASAAGENVFLLQNDHLIGLERKDERTYDSGSEGYDDEDRARQLALGTMMLRKHRAKALVDAAYNRYTWNDDQDMPSWFVDDEQKHYRPQLPIPKALMDQMKRKFLSLATKPIKKVAEARARKRKRATDKLKAARKKAEALANNPDISERQKVKAVQQAMRKGGSMDKPSKVYVVSKKAGGTSSSAKGASKGARVKMVDSRMKKDKRGEKRAAKKRGGGGGKRRH